MVVGHTQNEGDNMHSLIVKKLALKSDPIYHPSQWVSIIKTSKKTHPLFQVNEMGYEDFANIKALTKVVGTKFQKDTEKQKVVWNKICQIEVRKESPFKIFFKNSFSDEHYKEIETRKINLKSIDTLKQFTIPQLYSEPTGISAKKFKDLNDLCDKNLILAKYKIFFII